MRMLFRGSKTSSAAASDDAIDLLIHLLHFKPDAPRMSAKEALEHKYIEQFHDPAVERVATRVVNPPLNDDDKKSMQFYRSEMYKQIEKKAGGAAGVVPRRASSRPRVMIKYRE